jgi:hypothetical protein
MNMNGLFHGPILWRAPLPQTTEHDGVKVPPIAAVNEVAQRQRDRSR